MPVLRIALLTHSTQPHGDVEHTLALAEALAHAGEEVSVWTLAPSGDPGFFRPVDPVVQVHAVPVPEVEGEDAGSRAQRSIALLSAAFSGSLAENPAGYDIVHTQDGITASAVPGRIRTVHYLDQFTSPELAACHERALLEPNELVCGSAAVAAEVTKSTGRSPVVIRNGVAAARFMAAAGPDPEAAEQRRYWTDRFGDFVLTVGAIEPRKGTLELVRAMARVRRRRPGTRLVIAGGDGKFGDQEAHKDYRRDVDALAVRLRIDPEMLGQVEHAQLPGLVAAAGAFAFGSVRDGFALAAMEALAAGVPVVTRDLPGLREDFGDTVLFADAGDGSSGDIAAGLAAQLVTALEGSISRSTPSGPSEAPTTREAGQALAARHGWDNAAAAHLALYHRLISEGRPVGLHR